MPWHNQQLQNATDRIFISTNAIIVCVFISAVQQSDWVVYICICMFFFITNAILLPKAKANIGNV